MRGEARATLSRYASDDIEAQVDVVVAARNVEAARAALAQAQRDLATAFVDQLPSEDPGPEPQAREVLGFRSTPS